MEAYTGVDCINTKQCTLDFFCPYPEFRFSITKDDNKTTVYTKFDKACNEACAILAGFDSFAQLLTLIGTGSVLLPSLLGLLSPSPGGSLLTPASLIPGKRQCIYLISNRKDICSHINFTIFYSVTLYFIYFTILLSWRCVHGGFLRIINYLSRDKGRTCSRRNNTHCSL